MMKIKSFKEKKIIIGLIVICLVMMVLSYKQIFNLFDTSLNNFFKSKFNTSMYWHMNTSSVLNADLKSDESGNQFYILKNNSEGTNILEISSRSGFSDNECPQITFLYYEKLPQDVILEKESGGKYLAANFTITGITEHTFQKMFVIKNDIRFNLNSVQYSLDCLPIGKYKISDRQNNTENKSLDFIVYEKIPAEWQMNKERLQTLAPLSFLLEPDMDTRWYYINNKLNSEPFLETFFKSYKQGTWTEEVNITEFLNSNQIENEVCKRKDKFFFRADNPVKEWIEDKLIPDTVGVDEFIHSEEFKNLFSNSFGDSLAIRFGLSIEPMSWSHYDYQVIYSNYYVIPSEKIYESFIEKSE
jgi:hypothetical protein